MEAMIMMSVRLTVRLVFFVLDGIGSRITYDHNQGVSELHFFVRRPGRGLLGPFRYTGRYVQFAWHRILPPPAWCALAPRDQVGEAW